MIEPGPAPSSQAYYPPPAAPPVHGPALWGAILLCAAGLAALVGSFLPLFVGEIQHLGTTQLTMTVNGWDFWADAPGQSGQATRNGAIAANGAPMVFSAAVLLAAGLVGLFAAQNRSVQATRLAGRVLAVAGASFAASTAWSCGLQVISWFDSFHPTGIAAGNPEFDVSMTLGVGFWLLLGAAVLAVVAAIVVWLPRRDTRLPVGAPGVPVAWPEIPATAVPGAAPQPGEPSAS